MTTSGVNMGKFILLVFRLFFSSVCCGMSLGERAAKPEVVDKLVCLVFLITLPSGGTI